MQVPLVNNIHNTQTLALPQAWIENQHRRRHERRQRVSTEKQETREAKHVIDAKQRFVDLTRRAS